jgi:serine/threonine protein kinase
MDPLEDSDPRQIGNYVLEGRLGAGGMGAVYLGRSLGGHLVAVKVIHAQHVRDPEFRVRFRREVAAAQRVRSAFTAQVVAADPDAPTPWIATRYIDGPSLWRKVRQAGPLSTIGVGEVAAGIAEALAAIHAAGIVHRDLKPENVLLASDGPHIIDFGIARAIDASVLTASGAFVGTPAFMSPEQFLGRDVGPASDIFSLGGVIYFAATGRLAFAAGQPWALMRQILDEQPDLSLLADRWLHELAEKCLAKTPGARPTPVEILAVYGEFTSARGISTRKDPAVNQGAVPRTAALDAIGPRHSRAIRQDEAADVVDTRGQAQEALPRFDGLYCARGGAYLRFTRSEEVYSVTSTGTAEQVARWLGPGKRDLSCGKYTVRGRNISFTTASREGEVDYSGQLSGDAVELNLNIYSHINGNRSEHVYSFAPIKQLKGLSRGPTVSLRESYYVTAGLK